MVDSLSLSLDLGERDLEAHRGRCPKVIDAECPVTCHLYIVMERRPHRKLFDPAA